MTDDTRLHHHGRGEELANFAVTLATGTDYPEGDILQPLFGVINAELEEEVARYAFWAAVDLAAELLRELEQLSPDAGTAVLRRACMLTAESDWTS